MTETITINNKTVWIEIEPLHKQRDNPNVIPTEYFTATYFTEEPVANGSNGTVITDENGETKLFESPVAALSNAEKILEKKI